MTAPNFASLLDEAPTEIVRPKPLPSGTYYGVVMGVPEEGRSSKKQTPFVKFSVRITSAGDDVDEQELEESGGIDDKVLPLTFYITEDAVYRLDEFHEQCGIDLTEPTSRKRRNEEIMNAQIGVFIKHRVAEDGSRVYAEINRTFAL
jgi:hypothetical protein